MLLKIASLGIAMVLSVRGQVLPAEPTHMSGVGVTGAFEGWFKNTDGSFSLLLGYYNRNENQELDIPIGPNNRIEPGGPDRGQPTHFLPQRQWGMFAVKVPANFGENKVTWTLIVNGKTSVIPASLNPNYEISPFREEAVGNTPPVLSFEEMGPSVQGPTGLGISRSATVGNPLPLTVWLADDGKWTTLSGVKPRSIDTPLTVRWTKYRGPGTVMFANEKPPVEKLEGKRSAPVNGKASTTATFSEPGEYVLHVVANDLSGDGGGGEQCCWSYGDVKVTVKP